MLGIAKHGETIALPNACAMARADGRSSLSRGVLICARDVQMDDDQMLMLRTVLVRLHSQPRN